MIKQKTLWIFQTGEPLHIDGDEPRPMRAINLANTAVKAGFDVVLWSSAFDHQKKTHRSKEYKVISVTEHLEIRLIPSRGYSKHIGLGRLFDHMHMALNLKNLLREEKEIPDVAYVGYPPIETAFVMERWLKSKKVPALLDVKDLWPSIFVEAFPSFIRPLAKIIFYPYFFMAKSTMRSVDGISSMSNSYIDWCLSFAQKAASPNDIVTRLTSPANKVESEGSFDANNFWENIGVLDNGVGQKVFFVGTFSSAFEFIDVIEAAKELPNCQFILCGHGPDLLKVQMQSNGLKNIVFPGWINRTQLEQLANMSIASLAPYKNVENFILNIPNKIVDSLLLGVPVMSPLSGEVAALIKFNEVGFTYCRNNSLKICIQALIDDTSLQKRMSFNAKSLYEKDFDFDKVYNTLVKHLLCLCKSD